jgi:hypothetical protein
MFRSAGRSIGHFSIFLFDLLPTSTPWLTNKDEDGAWRNKKKKEIEVPWPLAPSFFRAGGMRYAASIIWSGPSTPVKTCTRCVRIKEEKGRPEKKKWKDSRRCEVKADKYVAGDALNGGILKGGNNLIRTPDLSTRRKQFCYDFPRFSMLSDVLNGGILKGGNSLIRTSNLFIQKRRFNYDFPRFGMTWMY